MLKIQENIPLAPLTTFHIGGPALYFVEVKSAAELKEALSFATGKELPVFVMGGGSNILVSDNGFDGLVIRVVNKGTNIIKESDDHVLVEVGSGEVWDDVVQWAVENKLWGIENLSGIPGLAGAAVIQNINAYGQHAADVVETVQAFDREESKVTSLTREQCSFDYRSSLFNTQQQGRYIILSLRLRLTRRENPNVSYAHLSSYLAQKSLQPTLDNLRQAVLAIRKQVGMLVGCYKSAGSFIKNATHISQPQFAKIKEIVLQERSSIPKQCCRDPWYWDIGKGEVKVAAACLVHSSMFIPGHREGRVGTSPVHALSLVNHGGATAVEVLELMQKIRQKVYNKFGVVLELEPELVGFSDEEIKEYFSL